MIYQQAQRQADPPRWRALLSLGQLLMAAVVAYVTWSIVVLAVIARWPALGPQSSGGRHVDLFNLLSNNLILATAVPVTLFATWAAYRDTGLLLSVVGRLRHGWLAICAATALVVQGSGTWLVTRFTGGEAAGHGTDVIALLLVVLLTTPLQAAGEEFFFRGWLPQQIGVLVRSPAVALAVGTVVSSALFAWAHGQQSPWLLADRFCFGVAACLLAWRTGGLEASVALHAVNNIVVFVPVILAGRLHDSLRVTQASATAVGADLAVIGAYVAVVLVVARRRGVRTHSGLTPIR